MDRLCLPLPGVVCRQQEWLPASKTWILDARDDWLVASTDVRHPGFSLTLSGLARLYFRYVVAPSLLDSQRLLCCRGYVYCMIHDQNVSSSACISPYLPTVELRKGQVSTRSQDSLSLRLHNPTWRLRGLKAYEIKQLYTDEARSRSEREAGHKQTTNPD